MSHEEDHAEGLSTWGSHLPVLRAIGRFMPVRSVIEFGAGIYSTPLFLDREAFPNVESVVSFEHDYTWTDKVRCKDPRHALVIAPTQRFAILSSGMTADLVFVDNAGDRYALVEHALSIASLFAIHDCQPEELTHLNIKYIRGFNSTIQTVVGSNTVDLSALVLA